MELNPIRRIAFGTGQNCLDWLVTLDWKKGDKEKGKMIYPSDFLKHLYTTTFGTIFFTYHSTVDFDLTGFSAKYDKHPRLPWLHSCCWKNTGSSSLSCGYHKKRGLSNGWPHSRDRQYLSDFVGNLLDPTDSLRFFECRVVIHEILFRLLHTAANLCPLV